MRFWPVARKLIFFLFAGAIFTASAWAQAAPGRLQGQIVDQTGAVIPSANITLKNSSGLVVASTSGGMGERPW